MEPWCWAVAACKHYTPVTFDWPLHSETSPVLCYWFWFYLLLCYRIFCTGCPCSLTNAKDNKEKVTAFTWWAKSSLILILLLSPRDEQCKRSFYIDSFVCIYWYFSHSSTFFKLTILVVVGTMTHYNPGLRVVSKVNCTKYKCLNICI